MEKLKCRECKQEKPLKEMSKNSSIKLGYERLCKPCRSKQRYKNGSYLKERLRKHTIRNGKPRYYTFEEIEQLVKETHCSYCGEEMNRINGHAKEATLDHVYLDVNIGSNLTQSCRSCNTSKGQDHVYDFYQRSEKFTDELWNKFVYKFASQVLKREPSPEEVEAFSKGFAEEAVEMKASEAENGEEIE